MAARSVAAFAAVALSTLSQVSAQRCIPLAGSTACPAFNASSISTDSYLSGLFPFLQTVTTREEFDNGLVSYINSTYLQTKYTQLLGCTNVTLSNPSQYYARYTTSVLCNSIIQNSIAACGTTGAANTPICADSCAQFALSEEEITVNSQLCGTTNNNFMAQIRADFTNCALPADSLTGSCITAAANEPRNCGFSTNVQGLCGYCASSSPNSTDSCCAMSNVTGICTGYTIPASVTSMPPLFTTASATSSPTGTNTAAAAAGAVSENRLSGGAIAGIVIGSIVGAVLLAGLLFLCCFCLRRRRGSQHGSVFNQPGPRRDPQQPPMAMTYGSKDNQPQPALGGRVARMTALEGESGPEGAAYDKNVISSESDPSYGSSPESHDYPSIAGPLPTGRRTGSLSSASALGMLSGTESGNAYSSPEDMASQSEQLPFFKDYYSANDIHPGDKVATLWDYQPRAADEFLLERGDMLKVVGIWDDGWATGLRVADRAEDYDSKQRERQRDSGISSSEEGRAQTPTFGETKAFPLVCVCLPQHWRKTIEGGGGSSSPSDRENGGHLSSI